MGLTSLRHGAPSCGVDRGDSFQMCRVAENMFNGEFFLLRYNALWSVESRPMFRRNISPPSSRLKSKLAVCVILVSRFLWMWFRSSFSVILLLFLAHLSLSSETVDASVLYKISTFSHSLYIYCSMYGSTY
jgi:hypothetical protein